MGYPRCVQWSSSPPHKDLMGHPHNNLMSNSRCVHWSSSPPHNDLMSHPRCVHWSSSPPHKDLMGHPRCVGYLCGVSQVDCVWLGGQTHKPHRAPRSNRGSGNNLLHMFNLFHANILHNDSERSSAINCMETSDGILLQGRCSTPEVIPLGTIVGNFIWPDSMMPANYTLTDIWQLPESSSNNISALQHIDLW